MKPTQKGYRIRQRHPDGRWTTRTGKPADPPRDGDWVYMMPGSHLTQPDIPTNITLGRLVVQRGCYITFGDKTTRPTICVTTHAPAPAAGSDTQPSPHGPHHASDGPAA